jgi:hypothetical protein
MYLIHEGDRYATHHHSGPPRRRRNHQGAGYRDAGRNGIVLFDAVRVFLMRVLPLTKLGVQTET